MKIKDVTQVLLGILKAALVGVCLLLSVIIPIAALFVVIRAIVPEPVQAPPIDTHAAQYAQWEAIRDTQPCQLLEINLLDSTATSLCEGDIVYKHRYLAK